MQDSPLKADESSTQVRVHFLGISATAPTQHERPIDVRARGSRASHLFRAPRPSFGQPQTPRMQRIMPSQCTRPHFRAPTCVLKGSDDDVEDRRHDPCCASDGGRSSGVAVQAEIPNHRRLRRSRAGVYSCDGRRPSRRYREAMVPHLSAATQDVRDGRRHRDCRTRPGFPTCRRACYCARCRGALGLRSRIHSGQRGLDVSRYPYSPPAPRRRRRP